MRVGGALKRSGLKTGKGMEAFELILISFVICRIGVIGGLKVIIVVIHIYICFGQAEIKGWKEGAGGI